MKDNRILTAIILLILAAFPALAQEAGAAPAAASTPVHSGGFFQVVLSSGLLGVLSWLGIFCWAVALLPLGLLSIVHSFATQEKTWPVSTKMLVLAPLFLFLLGSFGFFQGVIGALSCMAYAADAGVLSMNLAQCLYSAVASLFVAHLYLVVFTISFVILHFRHKKIGGKA